MRTSRAGAIVILLFLGSGLSFFGGTDLEIPPSPTRWVTDKAGFLSPQTIQTLDARLEAYAGKTGHQVIVYIGKTTGIYPIEEFAVKAFQAWAVGRKGLDDGVALFIMAEDRAVRIEVGYGLESVIPDITAGRIINDILIPKVRAGDADGAVSDAVSAILGAISGEPVPSGNKSREPRFLRRGVSTGQTVLIIIGTIIFLIIFITNPSLALWLLINILGGGRGRGFGGGGGFSGGGGRSGGGGASGRW